MSILNLFWRTKFGVGAHLHTLEELITCLIYLPRDRSMAHYGTDLYRINQPVKVVETDLTENPNLNAGRVEKVSTTQFLPNTVLVVLGSPVAAHGNTAPDGERLFYYSRTFLNKHFFYEQYIPANAVRPTRLKKALLPRKVDLLDYSAYYKTG